MELSPGLAAKLLVRLDASASADVADGAVPATLPDTSGNGHHATVHGAVYRASGADDGTPALELNGTGAYLSIPGLPLGAHFTLAVRASVNSTSGQLLIEHGPNTNNGPGFLLYGGGNSMLRVRRTADHAAQGVGGWLGVGWRTTVVRYNGTHLVRRDGVAQSNGTIVGSAVADTPHTATLYIGARSGTTVFTQGWLKGLYLFNEPLTLAEIEELEAHDFALARPDAPTVAVEQIAHDSVRITASAYSHPEGTAQQGREFRVVRHQDGAVVYGPVTEPPGTLEHVASGLSAGVRYCAEVRDRAQDGGGTGAWGRSESWVYRGSYTGPLPAALAAKLLVALDVRRLADATELAPVSRWPDASGNGYDAVSTADIHRPQVRVDYSAVDCSGVEFFDPGAAQGGEYLVVRGVPIPLHCTIAFFGRNNTGSPLLIEHGPSANVAPGLNVFGGTQAMVVRDSEGGHAATTSEPWIHTPLNSSGKHVVRYDGSFLIRKDGAEVPHTTSGSARANRVLTQDLWIATRDDGKMRCEGGLSQLWIFAEPLTLAEIAQVEAALGCAPAAAPPSVTIIAPEAGAAFEAGESIVFLGTATDRDDGPLTGASLVWTSSLAGQIGTGESFNAALPVGAHTITLTATDADGLRASDSVQITAGGLAATILAPPHGSSHAAGAPVTLRGAAFWVGASTPFAGTYTWTSSKDGALGTGATLSAPALSVGNHLITLTADDGDQTATDSIVITVTDEPVIVIPLNQWRVSDWRSAAFRWPP